MSWVSLGAVYIVVWWMVLFMVLPFGVQRVENPEAGHDRGAPEKPRLVIKAAVTSAIAAVVTGVVWAIIVYELIDFRGLRL